MGARRFGPLIALVLLAMLGLCLRLAQVQLTEHEVWANEAENLVRSGRVVPYWRGDILDADGRSIARDQEVYRVEFVYRDFRRGHPLGQVAHAVSSLEGRFVTLDEALANLVPWATELARLDYRTLREFVEGGAVLAGPLVVAPTEEPGRERRRSRRSDVLFYVGRLLRLTRDDLRRVGDARNEAASLLEIACMARGLEPDEVLAGVEEHVASSLRDLTFLTELLAAEGALGTEAAGGSLADLVALLEDWRTSVEDDTAGDLFREAAGFAAGRVDPLLLREAVDLDWIAHLLRWDPARLDDWLARSRRAWLSSLETWWIPRIRLEIELAPKGAPLGDELLGHWAALYMTPDDRDSGPWPNWRRAERLAVLSEVDSLFGIRVPRRERAVRRVVLPLQDPDIAAAAVGRPVDPTMLARVEGWRPRAGGSDAELDAAAVRAEATEWKRYLVDRLDAAWVEDRTRALVVRWEGFLQDAVAEHLGGLRERAREADGALPRLAFTGGRLDRAEERARFVLKDRGSRPFDVVRRPDYDLIDLLTLYPDRFAGFRARDAHERVRRKDTRGETVLEGLVGNVRTPGMRDLMVQREEASAFRELAARGTRTEGEIEDMMLLVRQVSRIDELRGGDGLEGYFDEELSGRNGYLETRGLQDLVDGASGRRYALDLPPVDGETLKLTIDLDLQRAARETLERPDGPPDPADCDYAWLGRPVGAIVLARPNGDVLAAASYPDFDRRAPDGGPPRSVRDRGYERTLRQHGFIPPGSVFKPFVAAYALDRLGVHPDATHPCEVEPGDSRAGYKGLHCSRRWGHGEVDMHGALKQSCNSYFAWVGEHYALSDFVAMTNEFGFGRPTGVRTFGGDRAGLREDVPGLSRDFRPRSFLEAGNGLGVIQATPMQVARAFCALATGALPEMRLVDSIGGEPLERTSAPLSLSPEALEVVRAAMLDVANDPNGSAYTALNQGELGFVMAAKTGSADLSSVAVRAPDGEMRVPKHTWLAGWFPPAEPKAVVVVFLDNTLHTSSKSAIWVARQFLRKPEVQALLREGGE